MPLRRQLHRYRHDLVAHAAGAVIVTWLLAPLLATGTATCHQDWSYFHSMAEISRRVILEFAQVPLWNPYTCGGTGHLGNPQTAFLSPFFPAVLIWGFSLGLKMFAWMHFVLGMSGALLLARRLGLGPYAALAPAVLLATMGFHTWHLYAGHITFLQFHWLPWILWDYVGAIENERTPWLGACVLGIAALSGGTYVVPFTALLIGSHGVLSLVSGRRRPIRAAAIIVGGGLCLGAAKVLPSVVFLHRFARPAPEIDSMTLTHLYHMFFTGDAWAITPPLSFHIWEYGNYVGPGILLVLAGFFLVLTLGEFAPFAPYALLKSVPLFSSLRVPSRYTVLVIYCLVLAGTPGLALWLSRLKGRLPSPAFRGVVTVAVIAATIGPPLVFNRRAVLDTVCQGRPGPSLVTTRFFLVEGDTLRMWRTIRHGLGTLPCDEAAQIPRSPDLWTGQREQVDVVPRRAGRAQLVEFSPESWKIHAEARKQLTVRLNQNFRRGFASDVGRVVDLNGLVAVQLPQGRHDVTVRFRPAEAWLGFALSLAAWGYVLFSRLSRSGTKCPPFQ
jgi:hypothetical protein